jgi:hypothetical protein
MKIAIRFGDNDFYNTFFGVLNTIGESIEWTKGCHDEMKIESTDAFKKYLVGIINELSYPCFLLFQRGDDNIGSRTHYRDYLKIDIGNLYINEEVDKFLKDNPDGNNEQMFIYDSDLYYENNESVYSF